MGADQSLLRVGQESIGCKIERTTLVWTDVEPGPRRLANAGGDQPDRISALFDQELPVTAFDQLIGRTQEH